MQQGKSSKWTHRHRTMVFCVIALITATVLKSTGQLDSAPAAFAQANSEKLKTKANASGVGSNKENRDHSVVAVQMLPDGIGYIRLSSFSQNASAEMRAAISQLSEKSPQRDAARALIVDLRNNNHGTAAAAIDIANMFLTRGIIVSTFGEDRFKTSQLASRTPFKTNLATVLLINRMSGGASEILSGALRDNSRAKVVGQTSGTSVNAFAEQYFTPNDTNISRVGIVPDIEVSISEDDLRAGHDPQLTKAIEVVSQQ